MSQRRHQTPLDSGCRVAARPDHNELISRPWIHLVGDLDEPLAAVRQLRWPDVLVA